MGSLLANVSLAIPLIAWMSGTVLLKVQQLALARFSSSPRGYLPRSLKSNAPQLALLPRSSGSNVWDKVTR